MTYCMGCFGQFEGSTNFCPHCGYERGTPPREAYHMPPESILRGRYIVGRVLGYGGFGVTYIGFDAQLERKVAIKEFLPSALATRMPGHTAITVYGGESAKQFRDGLVRFADEAQRLAKFNGLPGIVEIYDGFTENNTGYIVMQYLEGRDVKELLNARGPMPYDKALPIILAVANTLGQVHAQGLIHRDVAPDNIYITKGGEVKLIDFGAARYESAFNSKSLSVILKPGYAPEEQYRSQGEQGPWTDVYALAATFYKMLTGVTPEDSMERSVHDELKEPSKLGAALPQPSENAIMNALNIRAEHRTRTMPEFIESLGSREVTRTAVKPKRQTKSKVPLGAKILMGGVAASILLFVILSAAGVVRFGGGAVPEGFVNAPGFINRMEDEAEELAAKAGILYSIAGKDFNDRVDENKIFNQDPMPGELVELGGTVRLWVSAGAEFDYSTLDVFTNGRIDMSKLPDLTSFTAEQARGILNSLGVASYETAERSDVFERGVVIRYELDEGWGVSDRDSLDEAALPDEEMPEATPGPESIYEDEDPRDDSDEPVAAPSTQRIHLIVSAGKGDDDAGDAEADERTIFNENVVTYTDGVVTVEIDYSEYRKIRVSRGAGSGTYFHENIEYSVDGLGNTVITAFSEPNGYEAPDGSYQQGQDFITLTIDGDTMQCEYEHFVTREPETGRYAPVSVPEFRISATLTKVVP